MEYAQRATLTHMRDTNAHTVLILIVMEYAQ